MPPGTAKFKDARTFLSVLISMLLNAAAINATIAELQNFMHKGGTLAFGGLYLLGSLLLVVLSVVFLVRVTYKRLVSQYSLLLSASIASIAYIPVTFATVFFYAGCLNGGVTFYDALYFSYTTYTTLGYGDIQPVGACRIFSSVEAITGLLALGIYISLVNKAVERFTDGRK